MQLTAMQFLALVGVLLATVGILFHTLFTVDGGASDWKPYITPVRVKNRHGDVIEGALVMRRRSGSEWEYRSPNADEVQRYEQMTAW